MKVFLTIFLLVLGSAIAANEYVALKDHEIKKSRLVQDLRQLGAEWTLEQGIFRSSNNPLPNGSWDITKTESISKKTVGNVNYYRFVVQLVCRSAPGHIRANYVVSFNTKNWNTLVDSYRYTILPSSSENVVSDQPMFISLDDLDEYEDYLDNGVEYSVNDAIEKNKLPEGDYRVARVFSIKDTGFSFPYGYRFLVKLANDDTGKYYRLLITVWNPENIPEDDLDDYPPEYIIYPNK